MRAHLIAAHVRRLALLGFILLVAPTASAAAEEFALPGGWDGPTHLAFDNTGQIWLTLDTSWALGRFDPATGTGDIYPLRVAKTPEGGMGGLDVAPDGTVWVGTSRHLVQLFPSNGSFAEYQLPGTSLVSGDVYVAPDGIVWYALTSVDILLRLDPATGNTTQFPLPNKPFGPLDFKETADGGFFLTATYGNTYASYDPETSGLAIGRATVAGPVGIDQAPDGKVWIAEMGASTVSQIEHQTGRLERYPTTHSPYYPSSGPAGIHVQPDGVVWFVEHFADRISRLDPVKKTLHEYEVPSAPGTNVQYLAPAPDGSVWFAEFTKNRVGRATFTNEPIFPAGPDSITLAAGSTASFEITGAAGEILTAAGPAEWLNATFANGNLVVKAETSAPITRTEDGSSTSTPDHYVLLSSNHGNYTAGYYIPVTITSAKQSDTPALPIFGALGILATLAILRRRPA